MDLLQDATQSGQANDLLLEMTSEVVASYVSNNPVSMVDLPTLIGEVYGALTRVGGNGNAVTEIQKPAVSIKKSINDDYLICLEDGQKFKSLKRHIRAHYNLSPEEYRKKWGLPHDYPMVAPNYAKQRSMLAKQIGLGRKPGSKNK